MVHAMGKAAGGERHIRRVDDLERLAADCADDGLRIATFRHARPLWKLLDVGDADRPSTADVSVARRTLIARSKESKGSDVDLAKALCGPIGGFVGGAREGCFEQW